MLWKDANGDFFAKVEVIDNFFRNSNIITKNKAIEIMGENLFNSRGSRDISDEVFEKLSNLKK